MPANIPAMEPYTMEYCNSLEKIPGSVREIYYTNVNGNEDISTASSSTLVKEIMETVVKTVNDVLVPCCTVCTGCKDNIVTHGEGGLSK